jgi:hypothetical protein
MTERRFRVFQPVPDGSFYVVCTEGGRVVWKRQVSSHEEGEQVIADLKGEGFTGSVQ